MWGELLRRGAGRTSKWMRIIAITTKYILYVCDNIGSSTIAQSDVIKIVDVLMESVVEGVDVCT